MTGLVGISPVQGSDREARRRFLACLFNRMEDGPLADKRNEQEYDPDPDADPCWINITNPDLDHDAAKAVVAKQAALCDENWHTLYSFPPQ